MDIFDCLLLLILKLRKKHQWTIKEFVEKIKVKRRAVGTERESISSAYITRIEQYGEIPSPALVCVMAEVLQYDMNGLLALAKKNKKDQLNENIDEKYARAVGWYRSQRKK